MSDTKVLPPRLSPLRQDGSMLPVNDLDDLADPRQAAARASSLTQFRGYAMEHYDDLFEELEFRCQRAAMMHYHEANRYSRQCYYLELIAAVLGAASVSGIGAFLLKWSGAGAAAGSGAVTSSTRSAGMLGLLGVLVAALLEFGSKGSSRVIPTLCKRCDGHKKAAVGWQRLTRLTRSYRIQLRNPALTVEDYVVWYAHLVQQRHKVSALALVPSATYRAFNDPGRVFAALRKRRSMFVQYQQMTEGKLSVHDDYDDD